MRCIAKWRQRTEGAGRNFYPLVECAGGCSKLLKTTAALPRPPVSTAVPVDGAKSLRRRVVEVHAEFILKPNHHKARTIIVRVDCAIGIEFCNRAHWRQQNPSHFTCCVFHWTRNRARLKHGFKYHGRARMFRVQLLSEFNRREDRDFRVRRYSSKRTRVSRVLEQIR